MPRALILLPLMLVIQGAILYLLRGWCGGSSAGGTVRTGKTVSDPHREAVPIQGLEFYLTFSAVRYTIIL